MNIRPRRLRQSPELRDLNANTRFLGFRNGSAEKFELKSEKYSIEIVTPCILEKNSLDSSSCALWVSLENDEVISLRTQLEENGDINRVIFGMVKPERYSSLEKMSLDAIDGIILDSPFAQDIVHKLTQDGTCVGVFVNNSFCRAFSFEEKPTLKNEYLEGCFRAGANFVIFDMLDKVV